MHRRVRARHPPWRCCHRARYSEALVGAFEWLLLPFGTLLWLLCGKRLRLLLRLLWWCLQRMMLRVMLWLHLLLRWWWLVLRNVMMSRMRLRPTRMRLGHGRYMDSSAVLMRQRGWMLLVCKCRHQPCRMVLLQLLIVMML